MNGEVNIDSVNLDCWLGVVPQLIACMNHRDDNCREALHQLLMRLGRRHPQVCVMGIFLFFLKSGIGYGAVVVLLVYWPESTIDCQLSFAELSEVFRSPSCYGSNRGPLLVTVDGSKSGATSVDLV